MGKEKTKLIITDDFGNLDNVILKEEIRLLLPYADILLKPLLKNKLTKQKESSKLKLRSSAKKRERSIFLRKNGKRK